MSHLKRRVKAGRVIDTNVYHTARHNSPKRPRQKNHNTTSEQQRKNNERRSQNTLFQIISANFRPDDYYLTFTYGKEKEEPPPEEAKKYLGKLLDKLRKIYKKLGTPLKYIGVTEHQKCRIHHHLLINNIGISIKQIKKYWEHGFMKLQLFAGEWEDCERLANYFVKESANTFNTDKKVHGLRWISSKNLIHPKPEVKVVNGSSWLENPKPIKGYYIAFVRRGWTQHGYPYMFYRMVQLPGSEDETFWGDG
ncbi:MAG: hypothetical protein K0Q85_58 [Caproiciproducens sp.]|jgi:hypothetical protein|nr:hypothetical protein [Caproiciproducens sp.]